MSDIYDYFDTEVAAHEVALHDMKNSCKDAFALMLAGCVAAIKGGNKIMFFGNGGSAADAQHLATELSVRYIKDRPPIASIALTTDTSTLTAGGNDYGFDHIFERQIQAIGRPGDVAIGLSTSGKSPNVNLALKSARDGGMVPMGLTGRDGGQMLDFCDVSVVVPSDSTARIQEMHIILGHMLCGALEIELGLVER